MKSGCERKLARKRVRPSCRFRMVPFDLSMEAQMKYMMLIYAAEDAWSEAERVECYDESMALAHSLASDGKFVGASPLQPVATATTVRVRNNKRMVTDGPFAEAREQLGGYFMINAKDLDEAIETAGRIPGARRGTVEIRPVVELPNLVA